MEIPIFKVLPKRNKKKVVVCAVGEETGGGLLTYYVEAVTRGGEHGKTYGTTTITRKMYIQSNPDKTKYTVSNEGLSKSFGFHTE